MPHAAGTRQVVRLARQPVADVDRAANAQPGQDRAGREARDRPVERGQQRTDGCLEMRPAFRSSARPADAAPSCPGDGDEVADASGVTAEEARAIGLADERDVDDERAG